MHGTITIFRKTILSLLLVAIAFALTSCGTESDVVDMLRQEGKLAEKGSVTLLTLEETQQQSRYIAIEKGGLWSNTVSLVTITDGKLADFEAVDSIDGRVLHYQECKINNKTYWQFDVSNHQGNGYTCFFDPAEEKVTYTIEGTVDMHREGYLYPETAENYGIDLDKVEEKDRYKYSVVYSGDKFESSFEDVNSDGRDDLVFKGKEFLVDSHNKKLGQREIKKVFVYNPDMDEFVLWEDSARRVV